VVGRLAAVPRRLQTLSVSRRSTPLVRWASAAASSSGSVAGEHKFMIVSSALLTAAIPVAFWAPGVADIIIAAAVPVHVAIGTSHVIHDYLPNWPADWIGRFLAALVLLGLIRLIISGAGIVKGVFGTLWVDETE